MKSYAVRTSQSIRNEAPPRVRSRTIGALAARRRVGPSVAGSPVVLPSVVLVDS